MQMSASASALGKKAAEFFVLVSPVFRIPLLLASDNDDDDDDNDDDDDVGDIYLISLDNCELQVLGSLNWVIHLCLESHSHGARVVARGPLFDACPLLLYFPA